MSFSFEILRKLINFSEISFMNNLNLFSFKIFKIFSFKTFFSKSFLLIFFASKFLIKM